ncbi:methyltransferase-like protein SPBC21C3.07c [Carex littledalei]|uniref:Methyltransferase-like protein SPBC21C3.07c n=1 Tax=Carex littledalei TaxID=544730 RepID=A0A833VJA8_9POAL|nr:methyltransferase-like protein SPBC21C3.07c [Carex littledalei]
MVKRGRSATANFLCYAEYHSTDFDWEQLRQEIENLPSFSYHISHHITASSTSDSSLFEADSWRRFHRCHSTARFFKERRYLLKEFPELLSCHDSVKVIEVGCGNGSTVLPILRLTCSFNALTCNVNYTSKQSDISCHQGRERDWRINVGEYIISSKPISIFVDPPKPSLKRAHGGFIQLPGLTRSIATIIYHSLSSVIPLTNTCACKILKNKTLLLQNRKNRRNLLNLLGGDIRRSYPGD